MIADERYSPDRHGEHDDENAHQHHSDQHPAYHVDTVGRWICNREARCDFSESDCPIVPMEDDGEEGTKDALIASSC